MKQTQLAILLMFGFFHLSAQSLTGTNGLFKVPSAFIAPDGHSYIGVSFYPKGYFDLYGRGTQFTGMPSFITLSLFDKVEFMFRYTHLLGEVVSPDTEYFPDRMFTLRYNVIKEGVNFPAITFGFHDVSEALGGTSAKPYFLATYIVASKTFNSNLVAISPSFGYSHDLIQSNRPMVFDGFFGGIEFSFNALRAISILTEYDSTGFNVAFKASIFDHLYFSIGFLDMKALSGFVTYRFNLSNR